MDNQDQKNLDAVGFIFARGGSKGLPGKNIRSLRDKPLIGWAIEHAKSVSRLRRVIVSTDSEQIADVAKVYGAEVPFLRPKHLSEDNSSEWSAWRHALEYVEKDEGRLPDTMVSIPTTAPLRDVSDINRCLDEYEKGGADIVITITDSHRNPWFNMVTHSNDDFVHLVNKPKASIGRRQDSPLTFDMTTVAYVANSKFVMENEGHFSGKVRAIHIPPERAVDIDTALDFDFALFLMLKREGKKFE